MRQTSTNPPLTRRRFLTAAALASLPIDLRAATPPTRSFWVLKLLYPTSLLVHPLGTARLHCMSGEGEWILEGAQPLRITPESAPVRVAGPADEPVGCMLEIPGVIRRSYFGTVDVGSENGVIIPVVTTDCELATNSIVAAELPVNASPLNALAAQAVVSRSILCALTTPRHSFADFCDTTHCQFLRSPAQLGSKVANATRVTSGLVLLDGNRPYSNRPYGNQMMSPRYSAACGGCTEAGFDGDHQYVSVRCEICRSSRTARRGHGWGLCQEGAMGLARFGWAWREILAKYYPNATIGFPNAFNNRVP